MEKKPVSKRLYVGGLGHTVSKAELQERFGEFGDVLDAEIITRKDDQGNGFALSFKSGLSFNVLCAMLCAFASETLYFQEIA